MRNYSFDLAYEALLTPDIVSLLTVIHEFRGRQESLFKNDASSLDQLLEIAKIQSTESSNRIEGVVTTNSRLKKLVQDKTMPRTRSEKEIAGYRDVLSTIHESHDYIPPRPSMILQLHRDLYRFSGLSVGGHFKNADNYITEIASDGSEQIRFRPVPAWETAESMDRLCYAFVKASADPEKDPLLLIPMFILDFLCIHPFNDGNGRMSRLLTLLLLYRAGYTVGKYISIEKLISDTKESYYEALAESSSGWHEERSDYAPFVRYMLGVIAAAYRDFNDRAFLLLKGTTTKADRVREIIRLHVGRITKKEIQDACPDISQITIQRALSALIEKGDILKLGGGRYTSYIWNGEEK